MSLKEQLTGAMKEAMKAKDALRLDTIRQIRSALKNREIEEKAELDDQGVIAVVSSLVKQRKEAAQIYRENQRPDLAAREEQELAILQEFLPEPLSEDDLSRIIEEALTETGADSMKDMGRVMKIVAARTKGRADGKQVSDLVRRRLSS